MLKRKVLIGGRKILPGVCGLVSRENEEQKIKMAEL